MIKNHKKSSFIRRTNNTVDRYQMFQVRWGDAHDGYGEQYWEYNHGPQKYGKEEPVYKPAPSKPIYSSNSL